jgi:hypothetical protein
LITLQVSSSVLQEVETSKAIQEVVMGDPKIDVDFNS